MSDLKKEEKRNSTKLAAYVWDKRDENVGIKEINWEIMKKCNKYRPNSKKCDVCLSEKLAIMKNGNLLNKRSELMGGCRHKAKWKLNA